jgi:amino acid transporter
MEDGMFTQWIRRHFLPRRHSALLVALVSAFAVRPLLGNAGFATVAFSIALLVVLLVALYTIQVDELVGERETLLAQRRRRSVIGWVLAVLAVAERLAVFIAPSRPAFVAGSIGWMLFLCFVTWCELRSVLKQKEVTSETIAMSISVYLLLGLTWGVLYVVLFYLQPHAFSFGGAPAPGRSADLRFVLPVLIYFSLTTLSTIGYGDIAPVTLQARYLAVAEGITGQFYLAILVARLVGIYMTRSLSSDAGDSDRGSAAGPQADPNR